MSPSLVTFANCQKNDGDWLLSDLLAVATAVLGMPARFIEFEWPLCRHLIRESTRCHSRRYLRPPGHPVPLRQDA